MNRFPWEAFFLILTLTAPRFFLVLAETALASCRKSRLHALAEGVTVKARRIPGWAVKKALEAADKPAPLLFSLKIWIAAVEILCGVVGGLGIARYLEFRFDPVLGSPWAAAAGVLCTAVMVSLAALILGEIIPREAARAAPERITAALSPLTAALALPAIPLLRLSMFLAALFRRENRENSGGGQDIIQDELRIALLEGEKSGIVESEERTLVEGVFYLGDRPVATFMTHRSELKWLDLHASGEEARKAAEECRGQHFFPVADGALDKVTGVAAARDILLALLKPSWGGLRAVMKPPRFVPETMSALKAFEAFQREEIDFLCVIDEYGGFAGVLTLRNLMEAILGELAPSAAQEEAVLKQEDGTYLADGSANIDDVAELLGVAELLEEHQEYHTLAGFILRLAEEIPRTGAVFTWQGFRFKVVDMDGNRIDKLLISPPDTNE